MIRPLDAGLEVCRRRLSGTGTLAVAFSGGGDSLALMLVARAWVRRTGRTLLALHVDHGLQTNSAEAARRAEAVSDRLGVTFRRMSWQGAKPVTGVPAAARAARHRLIAHAAHDAGAQVILLGHTLDDQFENAVMRGAGAPVGALAEWAPSPAWPEGRGLFHCRPLLTVRREALRDWLRAEGLAWTDDPANADLRYARARARQALQTLGGDQSLPPAADIAALASHCRITAWGAIELDRFTLCSAPEPEALRLLQIALACASGAPSLTRPSRARELLKRLSRPEMFIATLAGARVLAADTVRVVREAGEAARGGLAPVDHGVWDGRWWFEGGGSLRALAGLGAGLAAADAAILRAIPASDRPSLPVLRQADGQVRLARLALAGHDAHIDQAREQVLLLVERRFKAACGLIVREDDIGTNALMANVHPPSYVGAEGKG